MRVPCTFRYFLRMFLIVISLSLLPFCLFAEEKPNDGTTAAPPAKEQKTTLIQIYSWATILPKELIDLQNALSKRNEIAAIDTEVTTLTEEAEKLRADITKAQKAPELQTAQVTEFQARNYKISTRLKNISEPITAAMTSLSAKRKEWQAKKDQIADFDKKETLSLALAKEQQRELVGTIDKALQLIGDRLKQVLSVGKVIGDLQVLLYSTNSDLQTMDNRLRAISIKQTSPSILSGAFYTRINFELFKQSYANTRQFVLGQLKNVQKNRKFILLSLFILCLIYYGVYRTRTLVPASSRWYPFAVNPLATTVFIASSVNTSIAMMPVKYDLPPQWEALLHILTMLAATRLTKDLIEDKRRRQLLIRLIIFMAMAMFMVVLNLPQMLILLYVFYVSVLALVYYFYQLARIRGRTDFKAWFSRLLGIFPAAILVLGISGYDQFAVILFSTVLSAITACLIVWMFYLFFLGIIDLVITVQPSTLLIENREIILRSLQPIVAWMQMVLLIAVQAVIWDFFPNLNEALAGIFNLGFIFSDLHISPRFLFTVIFVIYAALLTSKAIQTILLNKVLPRYGAEKGVQLSITRLAHYAILTISFVIMLRVLGFQLNQLALLGGALGVGIGFGLQAIVNNFASGLILLFERPIKVGDTIQIGTEIGEVKNLGLRATIIQTFDNAEIVVPNSDLVTGQVTNWTLAERRVRVRIPVGVAYGSEVAEVIRILEACADANPVVLSTPKPKAFFLAFGASSLDFELRVWISEFLDKMQVLSDLNQDIENEFSIYKIEIPFPQTDLHLRSVDEAAATRIWGNPPYSGEKTRAAENPNSTS